MKLTTAARVGPEPLTLGTAPAGAPHPPRPAWSLSFLWLSTRPRQPAEHGLLCNCRLNLTTAGVTVSETDPAPQTHHAGAKSTAQHCSDVMHQLLPRR